MLPSSALISASRAWISVIGIPLRGLFLQDQVGAHAAARKILDAFVIFGAVGMRIEVTRALVAHIFQELDQEEGGFQVARAKAQVLVIAAGILVVQVDVEELAGFPGLGHAVHEVQARTCARAPLPG